MLQTIYEALGDDQKASLSIRRKDDKLIISIVVDNEDGDKGAPILLKGDLETCTKEFDEAFKLASTESLDEVADGITKPEKEDPEKTVVTPKPATKAKPVATKPLTEEEKLVEATKESIVKEDIDTYLAAIQKLNVFLRKNPKAAKVIVLRDALRLEKAAQEEILQSTAKPEVKATSIDEVEAIATEIENNPQEAPTAQAPVVELSFGDNAEEFVVSEEPAFEENVAPAPEENNGEPNFEFE